MVAFVMLTVAPGVVHGQDLEPMFFSSFESGNFNEWSEAVVGDGDLSVSNLAAMSGSYGLQAVVDDGEPLYVQEDVTRHQPWHDPSYYHVSFRFDPNGFDSSSGRGVLRTRIFAAFEKRPERRLITLALRRRDGQFALTARVRQDDNREVTTGFVDITDDAHLIELVWHRAWPGARNGMFRLSIDGVVVSTLEGLGNSASVLGLTRLGTVSVKSNASGTLYWDDYRTFHDKAPARRQLVINEVDYDQPGIDSQEFLEIYNRGPAPILLGDNVFIWSLFIDGATHAVMGGYGGGGQLAAGQYLVIATSNVVVAPGALRYNFVLDHDSLGNGAPDGIVLLARTDGHNYWPCEVLDAISYEGPITAPIGTDCGLVDLVEGTALPAYMEDSDVVPGSLARVPNASDTNDAATDWILSSTPTPGAPNVP